MASIPPKLLISTKNELADAKLEFDAIAKAENELQQQYKHNVVRGNSMEDLRKQVETELNFKTSGNGKPLKYEVKKIPVTRQTDLQRSQTWHRKGSHRSQGNYWDRANTARSSYDAPPPMSPYGYTYNHAQSWQQGSNFQAPHTFTRGDRSRFPKPSQEYLNDTQRYVLRPAPRRGRGRGRKRGRGRGGRGRYQRRPVTCQRDYRGNQRRFFPSNFSQNQSFNQNGTPRRQIPTSCRLSQMAENDRTSFFPSSTRSSYKSMAQTDSSKIRDVFLRICASLEGKFGKENLTYPREIIWMIGPPGSGKSTLADFLSEQRNYEAKPIVLREICQSVIAKNDGKLKIEQVVEELMVKLFEGEYNSGVVVDGFVSITCARVVPFMFKYFNEIHTITQRKIDPPVFKFCVLYVNEDNSVRRQLGNNETGEKNGKKFDAEDGRKLYRKFLKRTQQVVELIEMHFSFHLIDANGTLAQVQMIASAEIASEVTPPVGI